MGQVTSADTESTVSAPATTVSLTTSHSAADSGDTDRPECSAAGRGSAADQSERSMELTPAVLPAADDNSSQLSADPTETAGDVEYLEAGKAGSESALGAEMKGVAQAEGCSDIVHQGDSVASGEELVSTSDAAVVAKTATAVDADSETGTGRDEAHLGDGDMASDRPENMAGSGPSISDKSDDAAVSAASAVCSVEAPVCEPSISDKSEEVAVSGPSAVSTTEASISGPSVSDKLEDAALSGPPTASTGGAAKSSLDDDSSHDFLALTYLVHPPDGAAFSRPYVDDFWTSRWARMDAEIRRMLRKSSRLASDVITLDSSSSSSSSDYDSSEYADDDDYEDSVASNSPIFVCEKPSSSAAAADAEKDSLNDVVLDENSSNAIVVGDEDDNDDEEADDDGCVENDEIDEILFSRESNEGDAEADSSIVVCDGDSSALGWSGPVSGMDEDLVTAEQDSDPAPANSSDSVSELESASTTAAPETRAAKLANGCTGVADAVDKPGRAAAEAGRTQDADVQNGTCGGGVDTAD